MVQARQQDVYRFGPKTEDKDQEKVGSSAMWSSWSGPEVGQDTGGAATVAGVAPSETTVEGASDLGHCACSKNSCQIE